MKIVYTGPHAEVVFGEVVCKRGEAVEFPTAIAKQAVKQSVWEPTNQKKEDS